jgi:hypothetical protein
MNWPGDLGHFTELGKNRPRGKRQIIPELPRNAELREPWLGTRQKRFVRLFTRLLFGVWCPVAGLQRVVADLWIPIQFIKASSQRQPRSARSRSTSATGPRTRSHGGGRQPIGRRRRGRSLSYLIWGGHSLRRSIINGSVNYQWYRTK